MREIEKFVNFSDFNTFTVEEQNKFFLEVIQSLLKKLNENDNNNSKKNINTSQKNVKTISLKDSHTTSIPSTPIIYLSDEYNKIDLIEEENQEKSVLSSLNFLSKSNSNSLVSNVLFIEDLVEISNNNSSITKRSSSNLVQHNLKKTSSHLKDFSDFNQNLTKSKIDGKIQFNKKDASFIGRKIERSKEKITGQKSITSFLK